MPNFQLNNTAAQLNQTVSEHYNRLIANYVGPLTAGSSSCFFCIQNGSKGIGLSLSSSCANFYTNNLNFNNTSADLIFRIPSTRNFIVTGNGAIMDFHADGTFSVGQNVDTNYKGLQVFNSCPGIVLKDSDAINGSGCQFIRFIDSTGYNQALISYDRINVGCAPTGTGIYTYNSLNIYNNKCIFRIFNDCQTALITKDDRVSILAGNNINEYWNIFLGKNTYISGDTAISGSLCLFSCINSRSSQNCQWSAASVGVVNTTYTNLAAQYIQYKNLNDVSHARIDTYYDCTPGIHSSCLNFYITPRTEYYNLPFTNETPDSFARQQVIMSLTSDFSTDRKVKIFGDFCAYSACVSSICTNTLRNNGSITYIGGTSHSFDNLCTSANDANNCRGRAYSMLFNNCCVVCAHNWNVITGTGTTPTNCPLTYSRFGLVSSLGVSTSCGFASSGNLIVCNTTGKSYILQNEICLIANSTTQCAICISGNTTVQGNIFNSGILNTSGICSLNSSVFNCFCSCVYAPLFSTTSSYISGSISSSAIGICTSNAICANSLLSTNCVCASVFCQNSANTNCFCGSINVGASCDLFVRSKNTAKVWGTACIINGWVANNSAMSCYYNVCCIFHNTNNYHNGVYVLCLANPIKAPISANFSVRIPFASYPYATGASGYDPSNYSSKFGSGILPITANLINCGINTNGTSEYLTDGTCYCSLFFTMTNECLLKTFWSDTWGGLVSNLPNKSSVQLSIGAQFVGTMSNYLKGIIDFSIYGC